MLFSQYGTYTYAHGAYLRSDVIVKVNSTRLVNVIIGVWMKVRVC